MSAFATSFAYAIRPVILFGLSAYAKHGQRVVVGQHLMQAASNSFLGWCQGHAGRHFVVRQLRDMKIKPLIEQFNPVTMFDYATLYGRTLARAHAGSGDPAMIAVYMGNSDLFDKAVAAFSKAHADQGEHDYSAFRKAIRQGRIEIEPD